MAFIRGNRLFVLFLLLYIFSSVYDICSFIFYSIYVFMNVLCFVFDIRECGRGGCPCFMGVRV